MKSFYEWSQKVISEVTQEDHDVLQAMLQFGGNFVKKLAQAALAADPTNLEKIKIAFPDYWARYQQMAASLPKDNI